MSRQSPAPAAASAPEPLLSAREAAVYLGVGRAFLTRHAAELGGVKVGTGRNGRLKFTASGLQTYVARQRVQEPASDAAPAQEPTPIETARKYGRGQINPITRRPWGE